MAGRTRTHEHTSATSAVAAHVLKVATALGYASHPHHAVGTRAGDSLLHVVAASAMPQVGWFGS